MPEQIKKRALIEKERLIYAPFSGVGGIVYDKDAVYIELGGSHSFSKRILDEETNTIMTNLMETKSTLDVKLEEAKIQLFKGGEELTAKDLEENQQHVTENINLYEKKDVEKEDSDLDAELEELRKENFHEERVEDSGRIRRKVIFDTTDDFSNSLSNESEDDDENDDEDEDEDGIKEVVSTSFVYTNLRDNKDKDIHTKVSSILKELDSKQDKLKKDDNVSGQNSLKINEGASEESSDSSDDEINLGNEILDKSVELNIDDKMNDSSNEEGSDEEENFEDNSEKDDVYEMEVKWKENLAQKAKDSFLNRQNSNRNIMKLVYGKFILIFGLQIIKSTATYFPLGIFDSKHKLASEESESSGSDDEDNIGGLFKKVSRDQEKLKLSKDSMNLTESSLMLPWGTSTRDWLDTDVSITINFFRVSVLYTNNNFLLIFCRIKPL